MTANHIQGSIVALITPFYPDGTVNYDKLGQLIDFHLENETDAILILGTTGESSTMSHEEDDQVCRYTVDRVAGRVPVIAGSGSNSTQTMLEKSLRFQNLGGGRPAPHHPLLQQDQRGRDGPPFHHGGRRGQHPLHPL